MPGYYCKLEFYNKICIFNLTKSVFHAWLHPIYVKTFLMGRNLFDQLILSASVNVKSNNIVHWQVNGSMGRDFVEKKCLVTILQALTWWSYVFSCPKLWGGHIGLVVELRNGRDNWRLVVKRVVPSQILASSPICLFILDP